MLLVFMPVGKLLTDLRRDCCNRCSIVGVTTLVVPGVTPIVVAAAVIIDFDTTALAAGIFNKLAASPLFSLRIAKVLMVF